MELQQLKKIIANYNKPVLFIGAGASISSYGLGANDITYFLLQDYYHNHESSQMKYLFEQEFECEASFENVLEKLFKTQYDRKKVVENYLDQLEVSTGYQYLAVLAKLGYICPVILTTNHETLIEKCLYDDNLVDKTINVVSLVQEDLKDKILNIEDNTIYVIHLHGSFINLNYIQVTSKSTFSLSENCKYIISDLCSRFGVIIIGYGYKDVDIRNLLQSMNIISKGVYYISYGKFQGKNQTELIKMLEYHNSNKNIIENCSFDAFFENIGKDAYYAYIRNKVESQIDKLYELLDGARSFIEIRNQKLGEIKSMTEDLHHEFDLNELLALKEFINYEINKNGEVYRLQQGISYLENALSQSETFTSFTYLCKLKYYLLNEYLNLFLLGDNVLKNKIDYLDKIIDIGEMCIKRLKKSNNQLVVKFELLMGEALKEKAMLNMDSSLQVQNIDKARDMLNKAVSLVNNNKTKITCPELFLGIAYRHLSVTYELEADLSHDSKEREKCIENWKKYSLQANEYLKSLNENTVCGYAAMNIAASNIAMLQLHAKDDYKKKLIEEGINYLQISIQLHSEMNEYRGVAWAHLHQCRLLRMKLDNITIDMDIDKLISQIEDSANIAVNNILKTDDLLGKGLAYQELGIALRLYYELIDASSDVKLESAKIILQKSVDLLKNTGFFRGLTDSCIELSSTLYKKWKKTGELSYLIDAYNNLNIGLTSACKNLNLTAKMEMIYEQLRKETNKIVELI